MKRTGLFLSTFLLFLISLYMAYLQGYLYLQSGVQDAGALEAGINTAVNSAYFLGNVFQFLVNLGGGNLLLTIIILALLAELLTLYPAVQLQLKQKKIHLFHKKLVDRFQSGELSMSESKRERDILYAVNEKMHARGALLFSIQFFVFLILLVGIYIGSQSNAIPFSQLGVFNVALLQKPLEVYLPFVTAFAYLLHALLKIHVRQEQDYISSTQVTVALIFAMLASGLIFFFTSNFSVLLSIYLVAHLSFSTLRFLWVENKSEAWGKFAQKELIKMLQTAKIHQTKWQYLSRRFNHSSWVRHLNLHLLEEGISMSFAFLIAFTFIQ